MNSFRLTQLTDDWNVLWFMPWTDNQLKQCNDVISILTPEHYSIMARTDYDDNDLCDRAQWYICDHRLGHIETCDFHFKLFRSSAEQLEQLLTMATLIDCRVAVNWGHYEKNSNKFLGVKIDQLIDHVNSLDFCSLNQLQSNSTV